MAISEAWYDEIESTIYTTLAEVMKRKFGLVNGKEFVCTTDNQIFSSPRFPAMYIHSLQSTERGGDLSGQDVVAMLYTVEVQIKTNSKSSKDFSCETLMHEVIRQMKAKWGFQMTALPLYSVSGSVRTVVARFRRLIAAGDLDIVINH